MYNFYVIFVLASAKIWTYNFYVIFVLANAKIRDFSP